MSRMRAHQGQNRTSNSSNTACINVRMMCSHVLTLLYPLDVIKDLNFHFLYPAVSLIYTFPACTAYKDLSEEIASISFGGK